MARQLRITAGSVSATAALDDSPTSRAIWDALPIEAKAETWGDEIYFSIPVTLKEDGARAVVERGDLGYWPPGRAFCIFFGATPVSGPGEIRPASPVNVFGRVEGDSTVFRKGSRGDAGAPRTPRHPRRPERSRAESRAALGRTQEVRRGVCRIR